MAQGIHNFTVQEAQNVQLGQCKSAYLDSTTSYSPISGEAIIAIQIIQDVKFTTITQEDPDSCFGDSTGSISTHAGGIGDDIQATTLFPAGIVLYGRWTTVVLASGIAVLYVAR